MILALILILTFAQGKEALEAAKNRLKAYANLKPDPITNPKLKLKLKLKLKPKPNSDLNSYGNLSSYLHTESNPNPDSNSDHKRGTNPTSYRYQR